MLRSAFFAGRMCDVCSAVAGKGGVVCHTQMAEMKSAKLSPAASADAMIRVPNMNGLVGGSIQTRKGTCTVEHARYPTFRIML